MKLSCDPLETVAVPELRGFGVLLRPIAAGDIEQLRQWRNRDDIRLQMADTSLITAEQQQRWFGALSQQRHACYFTACALTGAQTQPIGYANLLNPSGEPLTTGQCLETGLYVGDDRYRGSIFSFAIAMLVLDYGFGPLAAKMVMARVKPDNQAALRFNQALGYVAQPAATPSPWLELKLTPQAYASKRAVLARVVRERP